MRFTVVARSFIVVAMLLAPVDKAASAQSSDSTAVRAAMVDWLDALNALDVPRMSAGFADDITAFVPSAQVDRVEGKAAVVEIFRAFADRAKTLPRATTVPEDMRIEASPSLAVVHFMVRGTAPAPTRRRTFVFRKVGQRWLISHFHASDLVPPAR